MEGSRKGEAILKITRDRAAIIALNIQVIEHSLIKKIFWKVFTNFYYLPQRLLKRITLFAQGKRLKKTKITQSHIKHRTCFEEYCI